jgi:hypothetical protein
VTRLELTLLLVGPLFGAILGYFWAKVMYGLVWRRVA